jgi:hypothetical protein
MSIVGTMRHKSVNLIRCGDGMNITKSFIKRTIFIALFMGLIFLMSACNNKGIDNSNEFKNLKNGKYLVAFSKTFETPVKFNIYDAKGNIIESVTRKDSQAIDRVRVYGDNLIFTSERNNTHFQISKDGKINPFSLKKEEYGAGLGYGVCDAEVSDGYFISAVNVGMTETGYLCHIFYKKSLSEDWKDQELYGGYIDGMRIYNDVLYAHFSDDDGKDTGLGGGFYLIDLKTNKMKDKILLNDPSFQSLPSLTNNRSIELDNGKIVLVGEIGNASFLEKNNNKKEPKIAEFDIEKRKITKSYNFENSFEPAYLFMDQKKYIVITSETGRVKVLDEDFNILSENDISAEKNGFTGWVGSITLKKDKLFVLYQQSPNKSNYPTPAEIGVYDCRTFKLLEKTPLNISDSNDWWGENIAFLPLDK